MVAVTVRHWTMTAPSAGEGGFTRCPLEDGGESEGRLLWVFVFWSVHWPGDLSIE